MSRKPPQESPVAAASADATADTLRQTNTGRLLLKAMRAFNDRSMLAIRALGHPELSLSHASVLPHIDATGTRLTDLAERSGLRKQSVSQLVEELVAAGYLDKHADPDDKRAIRLEFTDKGRRFLHDANIVKRQIEDGVAHRLGDATYRELRRVLADLPDILTAAAVTPPRKE